MLQQFGVCQARIGFKLGLFVYFQMSVSQFNDKFDRQIKVSDQIKWNWNNEKE